MNAFTKEQLNFINSIKKELGVQTVWHYLEYLRIEQEIGHTPSIADLCTNAGETSAGSWACSIGGLKELGFISKKSRVQTIEDMLWKSEFLDLLWSLVKPHLSENGFIDSSAKGKAQNAVHIACDTKSKSATDKADIIQECEEKTFEKIENIWQSQFSQAV